MESQEGASCDCFRDQQIRKAAFNGSSTNNNLVLPLRDGNGDDGLCLEPKTPRRETSLPADGADTSVMNRKEEFTLKMGDSFMRDTLLHRLNTFRRNRELCDVVLFVHEKEILVHKVVMAACSPTLMDMFVGGEGEKPGRSLSSSPSPAMAAKSAGASKMLLSNSTSLPSSAGPTSPTSQQPLSYYEFAGTDYDCFEAIVNYAYTSYLEISSKKVGELYKTAHALQVASVAQACARYLIKNLSVMDCIGIRRQANISDDILVKKVDSFIAKNFAKIVEESPEFTLLPCIKMRLILSISDTKRLCCGEDIAKRALQYFQTLPRASDRLEQWIEQLMEKTHMLYMETDATLQDCSEMDDHSSVGASDIIQDYKRTGGYLPRTYSGRLHYTSSTFGLLFFESLSDNQHALADMICGQATILIEARKSQLITSKLNNTLEVQAPAHHITGATPVHLNVGRYGNAKLSSTESNSSLSSTAEGEDEPYKLIAVHQTAIDFWTALVVFHGRLVVLSFQLSEAENFVKPQDAQPFVFSKTEQQRSIEEEAVARLISSTSSSRTPLPRMISPRCSVGGAFVEGKIIVCGGYDRGKCLKSVEEYDLLEGCWRPLPDMAHGRGRFDAAVVGGRVYAVAGSSGSVDLKSVECYDPKTRKWSMVKSLQQGRSHNGCAALDGFIYCIGGCCEQSVLGSCERYNPEINEWVTIPDMQTARFQAGCTAWRGFVVVCGGCDSWKCLDSVEAFRPRTGAWQYLAPLKTARRGCAVVVVKDSLFVIGGHDGMHSLKSVEILDSPSGEWRSGPSLTTARANVRAIVTPGNEIYLVGGFDGTEFLSSIEVLNSESLGWRSWQQQKKLSTQENSAVVNESSSEKFEVHETDY